MTVWLSGSSSLPMSATGTMVRVSQNGNVMGWIELRTLKELLHHYRNEFNYEVEVGYFPARVAELRDLITTIEDTLAHYNYN